MQRFTTILTALFFAATITACNTVRGAGEDIESGGAAISNTAEEAQREIFN